MVETDVDNSGVLYDEHKRLSEETEEKEGAEPPKRRKLEEIEDEAMQAEDPEALKKLYEEYRDEHTRKFIEDQMLEARAMRRTRWRTRGGRSSRRQIKVKDENLHQVPRTRLSGRTSTAR